MKLSILKHVKVISIPTPYQQSAPPALLVLVDGNSSQKEPLLTKKLSLFHESLWTFCTEVFIQSLTCCNLLQHKDLGSISCYIVDCHIVSGPLLQWLYLYTQYCIPVHKYLHTQLYWESSPLTHSHARPYNQCVNDPCNTNGPTTAGDLLEHFNPRH